jgi:tRNA (adenine22-N1)-methyltransferase
MKSERLVKAAKYIEGFNCLADCGTDHGYLPIYCIEKNYIKRAFASDKNLGPLKNASINIKKTNLNEKITLVHEAGLNYLNSDVDVVSILGMGGRLISTILNEANLNHVKRLVLIANSEQSILRDFLEKNNWKIIAEELIKERKKYYQLIILEKGKMHLTQIEKEFGPLIINEKSSVFEEMILALLSKLKVGVKQAKKVEDIKTINERIKSLEEVIK